VVVQLVEEEIPPMETVLTRVLLVLVYLLRHQELVVLVEQEILEQRVVKHLMDNHLLGQLLHSF
jgi:hypothetical protein